MAEGNAAGPLTFAVTGGEPRVDLSLRMDVDGAFIADVMTERSLAQPPPIRLGSFRGRLPAATRETLASQVNTADLGWNFNAGFYGSLYDELMKR